MFYETFFVMVHFMTELTTDARTGLNTAPSEAPAEAPSAGSRPVLTSLIVLTGVFLSSLDLFIVNIAFPSISASFHGESLSSLS